MFFVIILALLLTLGYLIRKKITFWEDRGVVSYSDTYSEMKKMLTQEISTRETWMQVYKEFKSKGLRHGGTVFFLSPNYVPIDIEIVKDIMQTDFQHFVDRGLYYNEKGDPLSAHLFTIEGMKWKLLRHKLTPTFTSGKMKMMFDTIVDCTQGLYEVIEEVSGNSLDIKDILSRFTTDIIGSCSFGLECNTLKNSDNEFRRNGNALFDNDFWRNLKGVLTLVAPEFMRSLNVKMIPPKVHDFFWGVVTETIEYREKNNIYRKDFMHLLIQLKNKKLLVDSNDPYDTNLTLEEVAAQAFVFFVAGFETSSAAMTFCLYELAKNKNIQEKLREEMKEVLQRHDGKLTYDAVMEMRYLDQAIYEALRKYPPLSILFRICTKDYQVPGTGLVLKKGQRVIIPAIGIHYDPEYYPEPDVFDPDRFSEENKRTRPAFTFLAFGEGPRVCIGLRFGLMQTKVGMIAILLNYEVNVNKRTVEPLQFDTKAFVTSTKGNIWLDFKKITSKPIDLRSRNHSNQA